jgi:peptide/nickel transport system substrate-binding protein
MWRLRELLVALGSILSLLACTQPPVEEAGASPEQAVVGRHGGRLIVAQSTDPKSLNPVTHNDFESRAIIHRMTADLIHIDRYTQQTVPALAESWSVSEDGRSYTLRMREGLRFSDGAPCTADDVVFSFEVYLDEEVHAAQRELLIVGGKPISVRKLDDLTVAVALAEPYAAAERLFDGFAILPRHMLETVYREGDFRSAWSLTTAPDEIAGLGPYRLKNYVPGERVVLERNPYYWKYDQSGAQLPYLDELVFLVVDSDEARLMRFEAGEIDMVARLDPTSYAFLEANAESRGLQLFDLGPGLTFNFMFFNQNDLTGRELPVIESKQAWFRDLGFRRAISSAIDRDALTKIGFLGRATPATTHVSRGYTRWINSSLKPTERSLDESRRLLAASGFAWAESGALVDREGTPVELSIMAVPDNKMVALIQDDLKQIGIEVRIDKLELRMIADRLFNSYDFEACAIGFGGGDPDPNPTMVFLTSDGPQHLWRQPMTPWQQEIDQLMRDQISVLSYQERKRMYDRVQQLVAENLPFIPLVYPNILVGCRRDLGNFRPTVMGHHTLWNVEELFWLQQKQ